jgi:hypothetical protein
VQAPHLWPLGGFSGGIRGSAILPGAVGWLEHAVPVLPTA